MKYASAAWDPYGDVQIGELERVQRTAARMVNGAYRRKTCVTRLLNDLHWPKLCVRRGEVRLKLFHKILHSRTIISPLDRFERADYVSYRDHGRKFKYLLAGRIIVGYPSYPERQESGMIYRQILWELKMIVGLVKKLRKPLCCDHIQTD